MKTSKSLEKEILIYIINRTKKTISLYEFDRMMIYTFKVHNHPGEYLMPLLNNGYLVQINKGTEEMALYEVTDKGRTFVKPDDEKDI